MNRKLTRSTHALQSVQGQVHDIDMDAPGDNAGAAEAANVALCPQVWQFDPILYMLLSQRLFAKEEQHGGVDNYRNYFFAKYNVDAAKAKRIIAQSADNDEFKEWRICQFEQAIDHISQRRYSSSVPEWNSEEHFLQFDEYQIELYFALLHGINISAIWWAIQVTSCEADATRGCPRAQDALAAMQRRDDDSPAHSI
jgi:hypothetical protein